MKKKMLVILALVFAISISLVPAVAVEPDGRPQSPNAFVGSEFVNAFDEVSIRRSSDIYLGGYTIKQYLNTGYMCMTDESFGKDDFPEDKTFKFETNLTAEKTTEKIKVGIAYVDMWGTDTYLVHTEMGLQDKKLFTCNKKPGNKTKYYGAITNDTGGVMHGSFCIYKVIA